MKRPSEPWSAWIGAADASRLLDVTRPTLYAYVSRGLIRSEPGVSATRERRYAREDIERLKRRADERRNPDKVASHALQWGMPVLESAITLIADERLYYRGHDAVALAKGQSVDAVASLIWTGTLDGARPTIVKTKRRERAAAKGGAFVTRAQAALALASAHDPRAFDVRRDTVVETGWRILDLMVGAVAQPAPDESIDATLARAWGVRGWGQDVIRAALILCADHELNVSAFTARCVASAGSHPYAVVVAGLAALEGIKHGGSTARVESMLASLRRERSLRSALMDRLRQGQRIDGLGHPLYRRGDPRAIALLEMLLERFPKSAELRFVRELARLSESLTGEKPNLDFALGSVSRVLGLPPTSGLTLFAIGRTIGWIGHAIEQYAVNQIIRPRARYVGVAPASDGEVRAP
jgi:citrate synthase